MTLAPGGGAKGIVSNSKNFKATATAAGVNHGNPVIITTQKVECISTK